MPKRLRAEEFTFVPVAAPQVQTIAFLEVAPDTTASSWRASFDAYPTPETLEAGVANLLKEELDSYALMVTDVAGARAVKTRKHLKENEVIMPASGLPFSALEGVQEFFNQGGNSALLDGHVLKEPGERAETASCRGVHLRARCRPAGPDHRFLGGGA